MSTQNYEKTISLKNNLFLIGGGGHALSVLEVLEENKLIVSGLVDIKNNSNLDLPYKNESEFISSFKNQGYKPQILITIGSKTDCNFRASIIKKYKDFSYHPYVASKSSILAKDVKIGAGTVVMPGACIRTASVIGEHCIINTGALLDHECILSENVHIGPGAILCGNVKFRKMFSLVLAQ